MKIKLLVLLVVAALSGALMLLDYRHGAPVELGKGVLKKQAQVAPDFTIVPIGSPDASQALSRLQGRYVLVNAWASWCPPCVSEFPDLLALAKALPKRLTLVTLSADRNEEAAKSFLKQYDDPSANMLHMFDVRQRIARELFQIYRYPESILIDAEGKMIRKYAGVLSAQDMAEIKALVSAAE